jgi:hypothetical protein
MQTVSKSYWTRKTQVLSHQHFFIHKNWIDWQIYGFLFTENDNKVNQNLIKTLRDELNRTIKRLEHINELLNESELNNERLNEQVSILKEEIRR